MPDLICDDFRRNTQFHLDQAHLSRSELAQRMGCSPGYITQILNGHREVGLRVLEKVAGAIGVTPAQLLARAKHHV